MIIEGYLCQKRGLTARHDFKRFWAIQVQGTLYMKIFRCFPNFIALSAYPLSENASSAELSIIAVVCQGYLVFFPVRFPAVPWCLRRSRRTPPALYSMIAPAPEAAGKVKPAFSR